MRFLPQILLISLSLLAASHSLFSQTNGVTIGAATPPHPSSILDIQSTQGGVLPPRMTLAQRNAIVNPAHGLLVFNTTTDCLQIFYTGSGWKDVSCSCTQAPPMPGAITGPTAVCANTNNQVYSIARVPGASSYQWLVPSGVTIVSGGTDTSITVNFSQATGNIGVSSVNYCGASSYSNLAVSASNPIGTFTFSPTIIGTGQPVTFTPGQSGLTYAWTFSSGTPSGSTNATPSVTWASPGTYTAKLVTNNSVGCSDSSTQSITIINCISGGSRTFTNCSATGVNGPSQSQCNSAYGNGVVSVTNGIQYWTVPSGVCTITIDCRGARGGGTGGGGLGARSVGTFSVSAGQVLGILVGQMGGSEGNCGGGGGGSFVFNGTSPTSSNLMIAAGGGGGYGTSGGHSMDGVTSTSGGNSCNATGGTSGNGGGGHPVSNGGGGGGWLTNGANGGYGQGGRGVLLGATGGITGGNSNSTGGFGGGGSGNTSCEGGGGGGYSGGAGGGYTNECRRGAGGGSFNTGTSPNQQGGFNSGHGQVIITW